MNEYNTAKPYVASYLIIRKGNTVAFVLRENTSWMNGYYGLPSGKVEHNETFTACAVREGREEVGVTINEQDAHFTHVCHRFEEMDWVDVYFEVDKYEGEVINAEPHVHAELAWLDLDNLPKNIIPSTAYVLEQLKLGSHYSEYIATS